MCGMSPPPLTPRRARKPTAASYATDEDKKMKKIRVSEGPSKWGEREKSFAVQRDGKEMQRTKFINKGNRKLIKE